MINPIFVTGLYRSGTTFLQKLLWNMGIEIQNQSFQNQLFNISESYLKHNNINHVLPVGPELDYHQSLRFTEFLKAEKSNLKIDHSSKEIIAEAFLPFLTENDFKCISIIRNPADVLLSAQQTNELGPRKPSYWHLLMWKRSSAFLFHMQSNKNHKLIKFEDLVFNTENTIKTLSKWLDTPYNKTAISELKNENGEPWVQNASTNTLTEEQKKVLTLFSHAVCFPEMKLWGYPNKLNTIEEAIEIILCFKDTVKVEDQRFLKINYSYYGSAEILDRFKILIQDAPDKKLIKKYFYSNEYYQTIKSAL